MTDPDTAVGSVPQHVVFDTALALAASLRAIDTSDEAMLAAFDRIQAKSNELGRDFFEMADELNVVVGAEMLSLILQVSLPTWVGQTSRIAYDVAGQIALGRFDLHSSTTLLGSVARAILALGEPPGVASPELAFVAGELVVLANELTRSGHEEAVLPVATAALNHSKPGTAAFREALALAINRWSIATPAERAAIAIRRVQQLTPPGGEADRLGAFDIARSAIASASLAAEPDERRGLHRQLASAFQHYDFLQPLAAMAHLAGSDAAGEVNEAARWWCNPIWAAEDDYTTVLNTVAELTIGVANHRLGLDPAEHRPIAETSWDTFQFQHPAFSRAVPDHQSLVRAEEADELMLVIAHETTHVLSLLGGLGVALIALRIAAIDRELALWSLAPAMPSADDKLQPATLMEPSVLALAEAEQGMELAAKLAVLQALWTPWFEGLAMFTELAADPTDDPNVRSNVTDVILQLTDRDFGIADDAEQTIADMAKAATEAETRYQHALDRMAKLRLGVYVDIDRDRYLPGYLLVRSVVAAWRERRDNELPGALAARVLLHLTRYGIGSAVPDLSLPLAKFEVEAEAASRQWLRQAAAITDADINAVLDDYYRDGPAVGLWDHGRYVPYSHGQEEADSEALAVLRRRIGEAARSLVGANSPTDRFGSADATCNKLATVMAEALALSTVADSLLEDDFLGLTIGRLLVMPIGATTAQFWLNRTTTSLFLVIRTREAEHETGAPSYNGRSIPLPPDSFEALAEEVAKGQHTMQVTRVASLIPAEGFPFIGRNLMVYQVGEWMYVERRGLLTGSPEGRESSDYIRSRLSPSEFIKFDTDVVAPGKILAERNLAWIAQQSEWTIDDLAVPVGPWVDHVRQLSERVARMAEGPPDPHGWRQLEEFLESDVVSTLRDSGLAALLGASPTWGQEALGVLNESGRRPGPSEWLDRHSDHVHELLGGRLFQRSGNAKWDVTSPRDVVQGGTK